MPARVMPDHLTLAGLAGALVTAAGYLLSWISPSLLWLAVAGLLLNWLGDSLDGSLARARRSERPRYGFAVDHGSDLFAQTLVFLALGASPWAHFGIACLGLIAFLVAFVYTLIHMQVRGTMRITYYGFGPTEIRALLLAGNLLTLLAGPIDLARGWPALSVLAPLSPFDAGILLVDVVAFPLLAWLLVLDIRVLAVEDPADRSGRR